MDTSLPLPIAHFPEAPMARPAPLARPSCANACGWGASSANGFPIRVRPGHPAGRVLRAGRGLPTTPTDRAGRRLAASRRAQSHHRPLPQEARGAAAAGTERWAGGGAADDGLALGADAPDDGPASPIRELRVLAAIAAALDELPARQREVFVAHELEGRTFKELAAQSGVKL